MRKVFTITSSMVRDPAALQHQNSAGAVAAQTFL
jgi:hypothetical protein